MLFEHTDAAPAAPAASAASAAHDGGSGCGGGGGSGGGNDGGGDADAHMASQVHHELFVKKMVSVAALSYVRCLSSL